MVDDRHGCEIPMGHVEKRTGSYPNPDPHENQATWCRECEGLGHKPHASGSFAVTCNVCGGLGILDEARVVRTLPNGDSETAEKLDVASRVVRECLTHIEVLDHRLKALGELLAKMQAGK